MWFKKKQDEIANKVAEKLKEWTEKVETKVEPEPVKPAEEWIWVDGYKATDKDMTCRDYQYTLGEQHDMPDDAEIKECESGFHLCKDLDNVFEYYDIGNNHRFFKVRALVRKSDYERLGEETKAYKDAKASGYAYAYMFSGMCYYDKLAARSIIFERELTPDEILCDRIDVNEWSEEHKRLALSVGIDLAYKHMQADELVELGYSQTFALLVVNADLDKYETAKAVASQPDLSMDMKCWMIFK